MKFPTLSRMLMRAARYLGDGEKVGPDGQPLEGGAAGDEEPSPHHIEHEQFAQRFADFERRNKMAVDALITGSVQMIGLDEIRQRYGDHWPQIREAARRIARQCITRRLEDTDLYVEVRDEMYIILFGRLGRVAAEQKARQIAADITRRVCGEVPGGPAVWVRGIAVEMDRPARGIDTVAALEDAFHAARKRAETRAKETVDLIGRQVEFRYRPTMNLRKRLISIYECVQMRATPEGAGAQPTEAMEDASGGLLHAHLDRMTLRHIAKSLAQAGQPGHRAMLMCPVRYETLAAREYRTIYAEAIRELPETATTHLLFHVVDVPDGVPQSRLRDVLAFVAPTAVGLVCRQPLDRPDLDWLDGTGLLGVSTHAPGQDHSSLQMLDEMSEFVRGARHAHLRTLFSGAGGVSIAGAAVKAGFDFLSGDAVVRLVREPGRVYSLAQALGEGTTKEKGGASAKSTVLGTAPRVAPAAG
jgi:hypothetical protein